MDRTSFGGLVYAAQVIAVAAARQREQQYQQQEVVVVIKPRHPKDNGPFDSPKEKWFKAIFCTWAIYLVFYAIRTYDIDKLVVQMWGVDVACIFCWILYAHIFDYRKKSWFERFRTFDVAEYPDYDKPEMSALKAVSVIVIVNLAILYVFYAVKSMWTSMF